MLKKITAFIAIIALLCFSGCSSPEEIFSITVLKIGKADAIILNTDSGAVLIDTGEEDDGAEILEKSKARGIEKFDYMILTHYDKDHVGGAAEVINGMEIGQIIEPGYEKDSGAYNAFEFAAGKKGITRTVPEENMSFELDGVTYEIYIPKKDSYSNENDNSLVIKVTWNSISSLFTGDALDERVNEILKEDISAAILKVPHHGSYESTSKALFEKVGAKYAVITCSDKNPAEDETLQALSECGTKTLLTANGDVEIVIRQDRNISIVQ